jgi:dihydrolipoamide dehydrogenase
VKNEKGGPAPAAPCTKRRLHSVEGRCCRSSEHFEHAGHSFADHGIGLTDLKIDVTKMLGRKEHRREAEQRRHPDLFKKNKVTFFHGRGSFVRGRGDGAYGEQDRGCG